MAAPAFAGKAEHEFDKRAHRFADVKVVNEDPKRVGWLVRATRSILSEGGVRLGVIGSMGAGEVDAIDSWRVDGTAGFKSAADAP